MANCTNPSCPGDCVSEHFAEEAADIIHALGKACEGRPLRFALIIWDGSGVGLLGSNAHNAAVRHQLAHVLSAETEKDFRQLNGSPVRKGEAH